MCANVHYRTDLCEKHHCPVYGLVPIRSSSLSSLCETFRDITVTTYGCVNPHILDVCLRLTPTEGTELYAMSAIIMQRDMISTCFNMDTQNWCFHMCIIELTCEIISYATLSSLWTGSYTYVAPVILVWNLWWHHCHDLGLCETSYKENWDLHQQAMRASHFRSASAMSQCHSHHILCMANSACTDEVTHQNGFTLYVFSQTIFMLHQL